MHEMKLPLAITVCFNTLANEKTVVKLFSISFVLLIQVSVKQLPYFLVERRVQQFNLAAIFVSLKDLTVYLLNGLFCGRVCSSLFSFCYHELFKSNFEPFWQRVVSRGLLLS